jgi:hypothetical protein
MEKRPATLGVESAVTPQIAAHLRGVRDWNGRHNSAGRESMKRKRHQLDFEQTISQLEAHGFEATSYPQISGAMLVTKHGAGAVLVAAPGAPAAFAVGPGIVVRGEVGRLLDRGYQKFIKTSQYEIPAAATQLQSIHAFSEELKQVSGSISLYNESLGTTSDVYQYDRLQGREDQQEPSGSPWQLADSH